MPMIRETGAQILKKKSTSTESLLHYWWNIFMLVFIIIIEHLENSMIIIFIIYPQFCQCRVIRNWRYATLRYATTYEIFLLII